MSDVYFFLVVNDVDESINYIVGFLNWRDLPPELNERNKNKIKLNLKLNLKIDVGSSTGSWIIFRAHWLILFEILRTERWYRSIQ